MEKSVLLHTCCTVPCRKASRKIQEDQDSAPWPSASLCYSGGAIVLIGTDSVCYVVLRGTRIRPHFVPKRAPTK